MRAILLRVSAQFTRSERLFKAALLLLLSVPGWAILFGMAGRLHWPFSIRSLLYVTCYALFAFVFWSAAMGRTGSGGRKWRLAALVLQSVLALSLVWLICTGIEGTLLVVMAVQVATLFPLATALGWIAAQSLLMAWIISLHWPPSVVFALFLGWLGAQVFAALMSRALVDEAELRSHLALRNAELRATQQLLADTSRAGERIRIARELHDVLGHRLTAISLNLEVASHLASEESAQHIEKARSSAKQVLGEVREVVSKLRGDDSLDIAEQ